VIQLMLPLHECADTAPAESAVEPLHSIGDSATIEEFVVEPLHSAAADALSKTSCS
jgi:hypothetical protein